MAIQYIKHEGRMWRIEVYEKINQNFIPASSKDNIGGVLYACFKESNNVTYNKTNKVDHSTINP